MVCKKVVYDNLDHFAGLVLCVLVVYYHFIEYIMVPGDIIRG